MGHEETDDGTERDRTLERYLPACWCCCHGDVATDGGTCLSADFQMELVIKMMHFQLTSFIYVDLTPLNIKNNSLCELQNN